MGRTTAVLIIIVAFLFSGCSFGGDDSADEGASSVTLEFDDGSSGLAVAGNTGGSAGASGTGADAGTFYRESSPVGAQTDVVNVQSTVTTSQKSDKDSDANDASEREVVESSASDSPEPQSQNTDLDRPTTTTTAETDAERTSATSAETDAERTSVTSAETDAERTSATSAETVDERISATSAETVVRPAPTTTARTVVTRPTTSTQAVRNDSASVWPGPALTPSAPLFGGPLFGGLGLCSQAAITLVNNFGEVSLGGRSYTTLPSNVIRLPAPSGGDDSAAIESALLRNPGASFVGTGRYRANQLALVGPADVYDLDVATLTGDDPISLSATDVQLFVAGPAC